MKLVKTAGKTKIKMSRKEWTSIGKKAGWMTELPDPSWHNGPNYRPFTEDDIENQIKENITEADSLADDDWVIRNPSIDDTDLCKASKEELADFIQDFYRHLTDALTYNDDEVDNNTVSEMVISSMSDYLSKNGLDINEAKIAEMIGF